MTLIRSLILVVALAPAALFGASKDTLLLQREITALQEQIRELKEAVSTQVGDVRKLVEENIAAERKSGASVAVLESGIRERMLEQQKLLTAPVMNVSAKVDQMASDFSSLRESIADLTERMNKMQAQIVDLSNTVKVLNSPPAPPSTDPSGAAGMSSATPPQGMSAKALYESAMKDRSGGNLDLAMQSFQEYLRYYGNTDLAPNAQFYIGQIHYDKNEFEPALRAFDTVLEKYPENNKSADASFMKGMALLKSGQRNEAGREFLNVITKYPNAEVAAKARTQRKALGLNPAPANVPASARRRPR